MLNVMRLGDNMVARGEDDVGGMFRMPPSVPAGQLSRPEPWFDPGFVPDRCMPVHNSSGGLMGIIDETAKKRGGACCGLGYDCSQLSPTCEQFHTFGSWRCAIHDQALAKCGKSWNDFNAPCVNAANCQLADTHPDPAISGFFDAACRRPPRLASPQRMNANVGPDAWGSIFVRP
jgi:hypothetical protein